MVAKQLPPIAFVRECLDYDPDAGIFTWRERPREHFSSQQTWNAWNARFAGKPAGAEREVGRPSSSWAIMLSYNSYRASRLAWLLVYGVDPEEKEVDHIDCNPLNNRIGNLRLATPSENGRNKRGIGGTRSGIKGVWVNPADGKFDAVIKVGGKRTYLGHFRTKEEAAEARRKAAAALHGEFARHK